MDKKIIVIAAFMGVVAIVLGAFGAHGLREILSEKELATFETGVKYQMYHALFLLFVGSSGLISEKTKKTVLWLVVTGVLFFSGSIYLLATTSVTGINAKIIGPITPVGGLLMILGWTVLFIKIAGKKAE